MDNSTIMINIAYSIFTLAQYTLLACIIIAVIVYSLLCLTKPIYKTI